MKEGRQEGRKERKEGKEGFLRTPASLKGKEGNLSSAKEGKGGKEGGQEGRWSPSCAGLSLSET